MSPVYLFAIITFICAVLIHIINKIWDRAFKSGKLATTRQEKVARFLYRRKGIISVPGWVSAIILFIYLVMALVFYMDYCTLPARHAALEQTIAKARAKDPLYQNSIEKSTILSQIAELNMELAGLKYWKSVWLLGPVVPEFATELKPLE